ncbi:MAG: tryptophan--tRNA ligase [Candidatus Bathyarchaeota archaeon]|nr:tryptophan--tRNA ligase [Candidatus Bathyarchaeota archaeon]
MVVAEEEMVVTPWKVSGKVDYEKLIKKFGTQPLIGEILDKVKKYSGELHFLLRRNFFFCHRDFDWILNFYELGGKFILYTGRGPSGPVHIGHILPWVFTKYLQDTFNAKLYFQMTDDEKFLIHHNFTVETSIGYMYDNALDVIAIGFDKNNTKIISNVKNMGLMYKLAIKIAKHINFSVVRAVFGFEDSTNIGLIFFPAIQIVPCFLESELTGENVPCLIPAAIDQDPYWRVARDVASKLGYPKPAQIHSKFLPGLGREGKMSASEPETCIFVVDPPEVAKRKVFNAFTGGQPTVAEQKKLGGSPEVCSVYHYLYWFFEQDDSKIKRIWYDCKSGGVLCGDCKSLLADKVEAFLIEHQKRREKAKDVVEEYFFS